jgi:ATP-dependent Clp protease ATP-binding subunit ClpC
MTSNIGAHRIIAHHGDVSELRDELMDELRARFLPEFLNRIDDNIIFHSLGTDELSEIVEHLLEQSRRRVDGQGMKLEVTEPAKEMLIEHGHQPEFGARPLRRTIQTELDNKIASLILSGEAEPGETIVADTDDGTIRCTVRGARERQKESAK